MCVFFDIGWACNGQVATASREYSGMHSEQNDLLVDFIFFLGGWVNSSNLKPAE
jgi:hypothetical protein